MSYLGNDFGKLSNSKAYRKTNFASASSTEPQSFQTFLIAAFGGLICGLVVGSTLLATASRSSAINSADVSKISVVETDELLNAAATLESNASGELASQAKSCKVPLAQIAISIEPGAPAQTIRVRSGSYLSPAFHITGAPQRIAIPFPAPYSAGRGVIAIIGETQNISASLFPVWRITGAPTAALREVVWNPEKMC
jgi:hypothetical protein